MTEKDKRVDYSCAINTLRYKKEIVQEKIIDIDDGMYDEKAEPSSIDRLRKMLMRDVNELNSAIDVLMNQ